MVNLHEFSYDSCIQGMAESMMLKATEILIIGSALWKIIEIEDATSISMLVPRWLRIKTIGSELTC